MYTAYPIIVLIVFSLSTFPLLYELEWESFNRIEPNRGRVDDLSFFNYLSPFYFLLVEFQCTFSISCKILPNYVYYYSISIRM